MTAAERLEAALRPFAGGELPVRLTAWDGSSAGPVDAPRVHLTSPAALRRILWQPGELGAAQAYVTGELDLPDGLDASLAQVRAALAARGVDGVRPTPGRLARTVSTAAALGAFGLPPAPPVSQAHLPRGLRARLHQRARDRWAISHHYDLSHDFYALLLDESLAYSCAHWTSDDPSYTLADALYVALPVLVAALVDRPIAWLARVGVGLWLLGVTFEAVGDAQLAAYKRDPQRDPVMDRGLWSWTRHPNYFGDACVWWAIWLVAVDATPWALLTVPAPATMTWFLVWATGARPLERTMMQRPGYAEYAARTSMFVPLPPRRR